MQTKTFKDFLGEEVVVGDHIFYSTTGRWPESRYCVITRFSEKSIFVSVIKANRPGWEGIEWLEVQVKNSFVKINKPQQLNDDTTKENS